MSDFLFEIGLEEIPARMIASAEAELAHRVTALLIRERLLPPATTAQSFSTPRRLAVLICGIAARQDDLAEDLLGPSAKIAYKDDVPNAVAHAFAKKAGVPIESLKLVSTPKGEYLAATLLKPGRTASEVLTLELPKELAGIYWSKNMYWRPGKPERFVRPVRWILSLLDAEVVPLEFGGCRESNFSYGHRVLSGGDPVTLSTPAEYVSTLQNAFVIADVEARRQTIRKALDHVCRSLPGTRWREDHELVDKLTHLTEWPSVVAGNFEPEFLTLPEEVLVTVMRDHQNYFAVEDSSGRLAPHFLAVLNTAASAEGEAVIRHGNERVLRARFNDARFFWDFDQRVSLSDRVALLEHVTFQKDLGSYAAKTQRVADLSDRMSKIVISRGIAADYNALRHAANLAKADLTSELVKEFTELQGIVGGLYAHAQGYSDATADAIYDHYRPASMDDRIPRTVEGQLLAIADKADTIAGLFSLGLEPTGSKDPFALRRAANGVVKILAESALPLTLSEVTQAAASEPATATRIATFFSERLDFYLREVRGQAYDVVKAVLATGSDDVRDTLARAEALTAVRGSEDFLAVSAAFKRMKNILVQAAEKGYVPTESVGGVAHQIETDLGLAAEKIRQQSHQGAGFHDYVRAFELTATLRPLVDRYFEEVMVFDPDPAVRNGRLFLLSGIVLSTRRIADLSEIVVAG